MKMPLSIFCRALLVHALVGAVALPAKAAQVLVSNFNTDEVLLYGDGVPSTLVAAGSGGLDQPHRTRIGLDGSLLVASAGTNEILRYHPTTGEFLGVFIGATEGLDYPVDMIFRPDGYLYVSSQLNNAVLRYDATTGARDLGWSASNASLAGPSGIAFDADGNLYVSGRFSNNVARFASDGTFSAVLGTVSSAFGMTFDAGGNLLVASGGGTVQMFSSPGGTPVQSTWAGGLSFPVGIEPVGDGTFLVAEYSASQVAHLAADGGALPDFASGPPLNGPNFITVVPEPASVVLALSGAFLFLRRQRRPPPPAAC